MKPGDVRPYLALFVLSALAGLAITLPVPWWGWALAASLYAGSTLLLRYAPTLSGRRAKVAVAVALLLLAASPGVVVAAHIAGTSPVSGGVPISSPDNTTVTIQGDTDAYLQNFHTLGGTVDVITEAGNMTVFSAGNTHAAVQASEITGTWTNLTQIDTSQNTIQVDPADKSQVTLGKQIDQFSYTGTYGVDDGTVDFVYEGDSGESRVTITGVAANQQIVAVDADTGNYLDVAVSDGSGAVTFDALTNSEHSVLLQTQSLADPILENPSPTGDLSANPTTIEVDVKDPEFSKGDSVDVTIDLDGTQVHTETITANSTVSVSMPSSGQTGGDHDWEVEADPDFGDTVTETYTYRVPQTLTVRNERDHSEVIDFMSLNITAYGDEEIISRETNSGTIDLTGLPVNREFIVEVEPSDSSWTERPLWVNSIYQQQDVYLLNKSAVDVTTQRFVLNDPTAQFGPTSVLFIQRPINASGTSTTWQTVHSDEFGAEGVTAELEADQRYRLRVQSEQGASQLIGPYRTDVNETVEVVPGAPTIDLGEFTNGWAAAAELNNDTLEYRYADPQNETDTLTVWIHEQGDPTNRLVANTTYFDLGEASAQHTLAADEKNKTWVVNFIVDRDGNDFTHSITVSNRASLFDAIPPGWRLLIGVGSLVMFAGAFSLLNASVGAVIVALIGGLWWWIGLLGGATSALAIALALLITVVNWVRQKGGP